MVGFLQWGRRFKLGRPFLLRLTAFVVAFLIAQPMSDELPEILPVQLSASIQNYLRFPDRQFRFFADENITHLQDVCEFYARRKYRTAWVTPEAISDQALELMNVLSAGEQNGLQPIDYHWKVIRLFQWLSQERLKLHRPLPPEYLAAWDVLLTDAYFLYADHVSRGRLNPMAFSNVEIAPSPQFDLTDHLEVSLATNRISAALAGLQPHHPGYFRLRDALRRYRHIARTVPWREIGTSRIKRGEREEIAVPRMRAKLQALGDLGEEEPDDAAVLDDSLSRALSEYQKRHGLPCSGELDAATAAWLNQPLEKLIRVIELNLERWRWLPLDLGAYYVLVNIPGFQLDLIESERSALNMRVVVGKRRRETPVFSDRISQIVLNPAWEIPPRLLVRDKLPALRSEVDFFSRHQISVWEEWGDAKRMIDPGEIDWKNVSVSDLLGRYHLRQAPGASNPLGRIKFILSNDFNIYLHDTIARNLFEKDVRAYSSGCVRLEKPMALATLLLKRQRFWTPERLAAALQFDLEQKICLTKPVPVHILYWTCWASDDGRVCFRNDVYGLDQAMSAEFQRPLAPEPRIDKIIILNDRKDKP